MGRRVGVVDVAEREVGEGGGRWRRSERWGRRRIRGEGKRAVAQEGVDREERSLVGAGDRFRVFLSLLNLRRSFFVG